MPGLRTEPRGPGGVNDPALASDVIAREMSPSMPPISDGSRSAADYAKDNGAPANVPSDSIQRLVVLGYITAVAMPPVGFILGLVLAVRLTKPNSTRGIWVIAVSVIAAVGWVLALATGLLSPNSTTST
jgi:hypothetical protein